MTYRSRSMPNRQIADRQLAGMNAVKPVAVVILAFVEMHVGIRGRPVAKFRRLHIENIPAEMYRAVRSLERRAALLTLTADHQDPVRVLVLPFAPLGNLNQLLRVLLGFAFDQNGPAFIHSQ